MILAACGAGLGAPKIITTQSCFPDKELPQLGRHFKRIRFGFVSLSPCVMGSGVTHFVNYL